MTALDAPTISVPPLPSPRLPLVYPGGPNWPAPSTYAWLATASAMEDIAALLGERYGTGPLQVLDAPANVQADFGIPCHSLARILRTSPVRIAESLVPEVTASVGVPCHVFAEAGYFNVRLDPHYVARETLAKVEALGDAYGQLNMGIGKTIVADCSSPNIAKYMSVGHLRSTVIGESLCRIGRALGYTMVRDNHLGDWGTQFGMLGRAYELWGRHDSGPDGDAGSVGALYRLYVRMHEEVEAEKTAHPDGESTLEAEGRAWFRRLEAGDSQAFALLRWATEQSLAEFQRVYDLLGVDYEYILGESFFVPMLPALLTTLQRVEIASEQPDGSLVVDLTEDQLGHLVVRKADGASLYATRDLATLIARTAWFHPERILYVVGNDQREYFQQVFAAYRKLDSDPPELTHVGFGLVTLPDGKMSTRRGHVLFLEDLLNEAIAGAIHRIRETGRLEGDEAHDVARQVGCGAVIYTDLGQGRERTIRFDRDHALSLEGNTAPYIQYAHARARSVLRAAERQRITVHAGDALPFTCPVEQALSRHLAKFPRTVQQAFKDYQPSVVAEYAYRTASLFNQLYRDVPLVVETDPTTRNARLRLTACTAQVIKNALYLLGIEAPERM